VFSVLLQQLPAKSGALEDRLDQVILLQRLGQVLIHLCLDTPLPITHHGMGCQRNDGRPLGTETPLVLADLACGLKTAL
jgi:hypothetical protein